MDPNAVVLEISSDEEIGWDNGITDGDDDHKWISELLEEVNKTDYDFDYSYDDDDSDEVVVVGEVLPKKPKKKSTSKSTVIELDDDCVILDHDPDKPMEIQTDNSINRDEHKHDDDDSDDSDDLQVVSEKGQIACRDYPHPRHLCIKFPFASTPNGNHCNQCYCYVCDSLAPCIYWGNGSAIMDHCQATEKIEFWKLERKTFKNANKTVPEVSVIQTPLIPRLNPCPLSTNMEFPNFVSQNRTPLMLSRNKYQPGLVSQQLIRTSSCNNIRDRGHVNYNNLGSPFHKPVFKRTVSAGVGYRNSYVSGSSQNVDSPFDFLPDFQPQPQANLNLNPNSYIENFQPNPSYSIVSEPTPLGSQSQSQRSTIDPKFFNDISWPQSQMTHQPVGQSSTGQTNGHSVGRVDNPYGNWIYDEPGSNEVHGSFGLNEFAHESAFIDSGYSKLTIALSILAENERRHW